MKEKEEQRYGRDKSTSVDKGYLNGGEYRRKFDRISDSPELNRLLCQLAKKMLVHRSGTKYEDMYWIDPLSKKVISQETKSDNVKEIRYSRKTKSAIKRYKGLVTIHSHPDSFPPSVEDLNSNYTREYSKGIVVAHDGRIFVYESREHIPPYYYTLIVAEYLAKGYNEFEAQIKALEQCEKRFDFYVKEVTCDDD